MASKPFVDDWLTYRFRQQEKYFRDEEVTISVPRMKIAVTYCGQDDYPMFVLYFFRIMNLETGEICEYATGSSFSRKELTIWYLLDHMRFYADNNGLNVDVCEDNIIRRNFTPDTTFAFLCYRRRMINFVREMNIQHYVMWYRDHVAGHLVCGCGPLNRTCFIENTVINMENW